MYKKFIIGVLAVIMMFSMSEVVWADTISVNGGTSNVPVTFTVDNTSFVITIPKEIKPKANEDSTFSIGATQMNLRPDERLDVTIASGCGAEGAVKLIRQNVPMGKEPASLTTKLSVKNQTIDKNHFLVGQFKDSANSTQNLLGNVTMSGLSVNSSTESGEYRATIEFKVEVVRDAG